MVDSTVRAMTWNIWWRFGPRWRDRQPGIEATIRRFSPDIVALQEVWSSDETTQADELAKSLGMYAVFASPSYPPAPTGTDVPDFEVDLGIAVLSRWPILDQDTAVMPARHRSWDPVSLTVRVDHPAGPLPIVATCLDYGVPYTDDRIAQATFVAALATDPRGPCPVVLLMGDMNAAVESPVMLLSAGCIDGRGRLARVPLVQSLPSSHPRRRSRPDLKWSTSVLTTSSSVLDARISRCSSRAYISLATQSTGCIPPTTERSLQTYGGVVDTPFADLLADRLSAGTPE